MQLILKSTSHILDSVWSCTIVYLLLFFYFLPLANETGNNGISNINGNILFVNISLKSIEILRVISPSYSNKQVSVKFDCTENEKSNLSLLPTWTYSITLTATLGVWVFFKDTTANRICT